MAGLNGFQVVQLLNRRRVPKIIFVTAYNEYAIEAFEVGAIDYLLKPVKKIRLREAIQRLGATVREPRAELTIARDLQKRIVPDKDLQSVNVECAGTCVATHEVGGDYYSFTKVSQDRLALCIADISGKGFAAALMMANLQAGLRVLASEINDPSVGEGNEQALLREFRS